MAMVHSRDVQEIVEKLSSDKAKAREEGIKLLNTWLEGERSYSFCKYIGLKTAKLRPDEVPHSESWPFLISVLIQCASSEISSSKRRNPKMIYAKTLRVVVQRAEDAKYSGKMLPLSSVVKPLFNHVWNVLSNVLSFQSEYGIILRHLLAVRDYSLQMKKRIYCSLVLLYIEKVESSLNGKNISFCTSKEEIFRYILTLHSLLEYPPGDYPDSLREDIVKGFVRICSFIREEGKISRKLIECINTYLLNDGPNLGFQLLEIHNAMQQFMFRCWLTTHDRVLKDSLMMYARIQLNLMRGAADRCLLVEQLLDVVCKDLDQGSTSSTSVPRGDGNKDDKVGALSSSQCSLVELAAVLFYRACLNTTRASLSEKRVKRESAAVVLREALMKGRWLWNAAFCSFTRSYHTRICKDLFLYWFEGIWMSFDRILNSANVDRAYDGLLWTLRSLQELSLVLLLPNSMEMSSMPSSTVNGFIHGWELLWSTIVHGLPIFSNINVLVDAALLLLSYITSNDLVNACGIPQDVWDLQFFKRPISIPILYFISCYFSRKNSHADLRDILHLRKNLLKATLSHLNWKGNSTLNEWTVLFLPSAMYALCAGCVPFTHCFEELRLVYSSFDVTEALDDRHKFEDPKHHCPNEFLDCSVEVLTEIDKISKSEVSKSQIRSDVRVPREIRDQLLHEMETFILVKLVEEEISERRLTDIFLICSLLSNVLYGSFFTRKTNVSFCVKLSQYLQMMLENAVKIIEDSELRGFNCLYYDQSCDESCSLAASVHCFLSSPIFMECKDQTLTELFPFGVVIKSVERLLKAFVNLYESYSQHMLNLQSEMIVQDIDATDSIQSSCPYDSSKNRIVDMDLDVNDDCKDVDSLAVGNRKAAGASSSAETWKMDMISVISSFFSVSLVRTWDILFKIMEKEYDPKVHGKILYLLCQHPHWSSSGKLEDLVNIMKDIITEQVALKLACDNVLTCTHVLLAKLSSLDALGKEKCGLCSGEVETEQCFLSIGNIVHKLSELGLHWFGRVKLIDCICSLVLLHPDIGQTMIEQLLLMLKDTDYRVRLFLARRIGVLFRTWDGHEELFQDICFNFGVQMVVYCKGNVISAKEVLAAGPQPQPIMETVVLTLMHLAFHSEKIELEAVFMICVVSAVDPYHRELVCAVLDNLSKELQYMTRMKYLEELLGSILFCWIACGVSLVALVETRYLFIPDAEPDHFLLYCCPWLLSALLLHENSSDLNWVAKVICQPLSILIKNHFASIFSICMALHCSTKPESERATHVLQSSILQFAQISENERDKLIKRHMVSIVSCILSLCSCSYEPIIPFFSNDTVSLAIRTVVDGFLDLHRDDTHRSAAVVDKINIFRPDRVFMFLVEIHYKIAAASHYRHKCHRLLGIEVLISILGPRAGVLSTSNYLFNLVGPLIGCHALQEQCCRILSVLLVSFKKNPSANIIGMLGEQLQYLVSKLVACCIRSNTKESRDCTAKQVLSLLHLLTVDSEPPMHDYVKELEPFPEFKIFDEIRKFHEELCHSYSIRDHLLKFVKCSLYLPSRLLLPSLQALHKRLLNGETFRRGGKAEGCFNDRYWHGDHEIVHAVWTLVQMCGSDDASGVRELISDFISRVGAGDPYSVVFHLPGASSHIRLGKSNDISYAVETRSSINASVPDEHLVVLMKFLMKYLMDDSVKIVDMASQTLRGILSTERGQIALRSFDSHQRSLIEVHSKGVNTELVESFLLDLDRKSKVEAVSLEKSSVWVTDGKSFDMWICPLVYSLIIYCNDVIIRLCQDIILCKGEVAEFLLPSIFVNIATRKDLEIDLHKIICQQLKEHIFTESNKLMKSILVVLNCLNELRICHVMERSSTTPSKHELHKNSKPSGYSSKSRSTPAKARESKVVSSVLAKSPSSWEKVYWLCIDYLLVAKSAVSCGSYFTSVMYVEHWCEEQFKALTIGGPDFSDNEMLPDHVEVLVSAVTRINEPDSLYGILQSHKLNSQIITFEHEGNWGKALEYYDLQVQSGVSVQKGCSSRISAMQQSGLVNHSSFALEVDETRQSRPYKGLIRSLQQIGCIHVLDMYCQGLTSSKDQLQHDLEFAELQYESAWRTENWDFCLPYVGAGFPPTQNIKYDHFNENLHSCLRALKEGDFSDFLRKLRESKQELVWSVSHASEESTEHIYLTIIKLQMLYHLGMAWDLRWRTCQYNNMFFPQKLDVSLEPVIPSVEQLSWLDMDWCSILQQTQLHMNLLEPFIAFRRVLLQILSCRDYTLKHLLQSATTLRKGSRCSQAAAALHEFKILSVETMGHSSSLYWRGRLEEAKLFRAQGQNEMAINLAMYISQNYQSNEEASDVYRLIGKWLADTRSSNSRTILEKYLKPAVSMAEDVNTTDKKAMERKCQTHFHLAHYADALFRSHEERLNSNEWQAALRLRKHKTIELEALIKRLKNSTKGEKTDYSMKIQELQKQIAMDKEDAQKLQDDRDNFLSLALEGYKCCLVIGEKYDVRVVFRIVSLWFSLSSRKDVVNSMLSTIDEVQSFKFIPLVYQIASRMGSTKDGQGPSKFQFALVSLVKKMAIDHPYHTILQLLALANGDRIKDKQRSRGSFVVDMDKKLAAENLLNELSSYHGAIIQQMKQMVEIYIKLAEMETKREDTNKRVTLPRDLRNLPVLELVPVVTATISIDRNCQYREGTFPYFKGLGDSVMIMNGINAPKVVECLGSDGCRYRQLAKSGNDDLRQDAVMEQFFGLVNTFLRNHQDTWKRRLGVRTYKVIPFTPSAGVLEWVNGTLPLGEYLIGSMRNGGAHGRYGIGDWSFLKCREHMNNERDKRKAFQEVCGNFRPVMHHFFLERFLHPAEWFEKRLAYTRSVAASSMVGYIVGLGDRHSMNILIDQATAEVVHIDLGVAFEQGLMLKTPERVPFRLTRDIIDGMGVTGVEGVFRRCCEETLSVMRTNKEALLTIVEVFIHDPLYKWALSPLKALQRQKEMDDDLDASLEEPQNEYQGNKDAARALLRVKQKLDGYEDGEMRSIHGQVQQLIQDAIDPERLCQMFPGWGAWL